MANVIHIAGEDWNYAWTMNKLRKSIAFNQAQKNFEAAAKQKNLLRSFMEDILGRPSSDEDTAEAVGDDLAA